MPLTRKRSRIPKSRKNMNRGRFIGPIQSKAPKKKNSQARFNVSSKQYNLNKRISNIMSRMAETKLLSTAKINHLAANGTPSSVVDDGASPPVPTIYAWRGILEGIPTGWDSGLESLGGIISTDGVSGNQHIGNYIYLKKTHLTFQIDMFFDKLARPPVQFRMILMKARQAVTPSGATEYPQNTMFLSSGGEAVGFTTTGALAMNSFEVMNQPLNKRDWVILKDRKFTLTHPLLQQFDADGKPASSAGYSGKYPSRKTFTLNCPHYAKTRLSTTGHPQNYDARYCVYIFAQSIGNQGLYPPDRWAVSMRGTTSFTDN